MNVIKCADLNEIRSRREGMPPKLPKIKAKLDAQTEEVFLDKLAEVFAEQYKKENERKGQAI